VRDYSSTVHKHTSLEVHFTLRSNIIYLRGPLLVGTKPPLPAASVYLPVLKKKIKNPYQFDEGSVMNVFHEGIKLLILAGQM
jgi:hypothetical protein